jgi:hypothetical protein
MTARIVGPRIGDAPRYVRTETCAICGQEITFAEAKDKTENPAGGDAFEMHLSNEHQAAELLRFVAEHARVVRTFRLHPEGPAETPR